MLIIWDNAIQKYIYLLHNKLGAVLTIVLFLCFLALIYFLVRGLINPKKALKGDKASRLRVFGVYGGASFICFLAIGISAQNDNKKNLEAPVAAATAESKQAPAEAPKPVAKVEEKPEEVIKKKLQKIDSNTTVEVQAETAEGFRIVVNFEPTAIWDMPAYIKDVGFRIIKIGRKLKEDNVKVSSLVYRGTVPSTDAYGNSGKSEAITLTISGDDFAKVNWAEISHMQILNLSEVYFRPLGKKGAIEFCQDKDNLDRAELFCSAVVKS